jgi:hypothetical protein
MSIFFDLDGVIRNICGIDRENWQNWDDLIDGQTVVEYINADLKLLYTAPVTKYYPLIESFPFVHIITCQPEHWRPYTMCWIQEHFEKNRFDVDFVLNASEKLSMLKEGDRIVEDYPLFDDYSKVILIDYPYNRNVTGAVRVRNVDELKVVMGVK